MRKQFCSITHAALIECAGDPINWETYEPGFLDPEMLEYYKRCPVEIKPDILIKLIEVNERYIK